MMDPWTIIGWLGVAIIIIVMLTAPFAVVGLLRARRRIVGEFDRTGEEIDRVRAEVRAPLRRRPLAPPPAPPGTNPPARPTR